MWSMLTPNFSMMEDYEGANLMQVEASVRRRLLIDSEMVAAGAVVAGPLGVR